MTIDNLNLEVPPSPTTFDLARFIRSMETIFTRHEIREVFNNPKPHNIRIINDANSPTINKYFHKFHIHRTNVSHMKTIHIDRNHWNFFSPSKSEEPKKSSFYHRQQTANDNNNKSACSVLYFSFLAFIDSSSSSAKIPFHYKNVLKGTQLYLLCVRIYIRTYVATEENIIFRAQPARLENINIRFYHLLSSTIIIARNTGKKTHRTRCSIQQ